MPVDKKLQEKKKLDQALLDYYNGNLKKNEGAKEERKAKDKVKLLYGDNKEAYTLAISNTISLQVATITEDTEEIDPKLLFEKNPKAFWELVTVPKTNAIARLGAVDAALVTRVVPKTELKIKKIKQGVDDNED